MSLWDLASGIGDFLTLFWRKRKHDDAACDAAREAYKATEEGTKLRTLEEELKKLNTMQSPTKKIQNHQPEEQSRV